MTAPSPAAILAELARRAKARQEHTLEFELPEKFFGDFFGAQHALVHDDSPESASVCSRRSGKSWGIAGKLMKRGYADPGGLSVYIARSKGDARLILWPDVLEKMRDTYKLPITLREVDNQLMVLLPNKHRIWLSGCKDQSEIGKFRGKKYQTVVVDECQELPFLEQLISESIHHALVDKRGHLVLAGTPSPVPAGLFYVATTGDGGPKWPTHSWTIFDNPHIPHAREEYERYLKRYGRGEDHPTVQREWWGRWVKDVEALVAPFDADINGFRAADLPPGEYDYAVIIDLGAGAALSTAFLVMAQRRGFPETYILSAEKRAHMIPSTIAARAEHLARQLPKWPTIVVDEGGLGVGYAEEMRLTYGLNVQRAEKSKKRAFLEIFTGDLRAGTIKVDPFTCRPLIDEMRLCQWLPDKSEIDPRFEDHAIMGAVYGARALRPNYRPEENPPVPGSPEWYKAQHAAERKLVQEQVKRRQKTRSGVPWR